MCKVNLQKRIEEFKTRINLLYRDSLNKDLMDKYEKHFKKVLYSEIRPKDELLAMAAKIKFVGFLVKQKDDKSATGRSYRLLLSKNSSSLRRASFAVLSGYYEWNNILAYGKRVPDNIEVMPSSESSFSPLDEIIVYSRGKETGLGYNTPTLSVEQIMAQIPYGIASKVVAFSLQLEDKYPLDNYNQVMGMYGFKVILYTQKVD